MRQLKRPTDLRLSQSATQKPLPGRGIDQEAT
jgi:hypothetical protein